MTYRAGDKIRHKQNVALSWEIISVTGERVEISYLGIPELIRDVSVSWVSRSYVIFRRAKMGRRLEL